ncbi:hypothetical protein EV652_106454 [Kribbella steppae]|uniref:Uncharacterized protein n=1 Tax=Kribbella steppae TaxID=2512223 RepID=A0A4R2HJE6_9ACTN|nr:hypothetical protein EV652_106454 [Kribbella steppae]
MATDYAPTLNTSPGGSIDLQYTFTLDNDLIIRLVIAP